MTRTYRILQVVLETTKLGIPGQRKEAFVPVATFESAELSQVPQPLHCVLSIVGSNIFLDSSFETDWSEQRATVQPRQGTSAVRDSRAQALALPVCARGLVLKQCFDREEISDHDFASRI